MKRSGILSAARVGGVATAAAIALVACGSSKSTTSAQGSPAPTPSKTSSPSPSPAPLPPGCHGGIANDLNSTLEILTDPSNCPGSVNAYWKSQLGDTWTEPVFIPYVDGEVPKDQCGARQPDPEEFADNAFYCRLDDTIAYSRTLLNKLYNEGGPYLPVVVLEHELGHRAAQLGDRVGVISRSDENQADCAAGVTTKFARKAGRLPLSDVIASAKLLYQLGDTRNFGNEVAQSPDAHGTPSQRVIAFGRGYFQDINACYRLGEAPTGSVA